MIRELELDHGSIVEYLRLKAEMRVMTLPFETMQRRVYHSYQHLLEGVFVKRQVDLSDDLYNEEKDK